MGSVICRIIKKRILVPVAILALPVLFNIFFYNKDVKAAEDEWDVVNDSYSSVEIKDMKVTMSGGEIIIIARSKAASKETRIRYQTIGFGVSETYQEVRVRTKGYSGPAAPANVNILYLTEGQKKDLGVDEDGYRKTQFTFSAEAVNEKIGSKLQSITKGKKVYLNAVFQSYYLNDDDSRTIRKGKDGGITSWQEMMDAEIWGSDTLKGFEKYYNCEVGFVPGVQHNYLYHDYPDSEPVFKEQLDDKYVNAMVEFKKHVDKTSKSATGIEYDLSGYYIINRNNRSTIVGVKNIKGDPDTIYQIVTDASGKTRTPLGGVEVHIVYNKLPVQDNTYPCNLYYTFNGVKTKVASLPKHKIGDSISISDMHDKCGEKLSDNDHDVYNLIGFNITAIKEGITLGKVTKMTVGVDGKTEKNVLGASVKVVKGGINIYLHYTDSGHDIPPSIPTTTPKPTPPPYDDDLPGGTASKDLDIFSNVGEIRADIRGHERFTVALGVPTTESLYTQVRGNEYNISYYFNRRVVEKVYSIRVRKVYNLSWTDAKDKTKVKTDSVSVEQAIPVRRVCSYWEIVNFNYYVIDKAVIYNKALPGGIGTMYPDSVYYSPPAAITINRGGPESHIINPPQASPGYVIELPSEDIGGVGVKPTVPPQDFTYEANTMTEEMKVINDYLSFGGTVVLDGEIYTKKVPNLTNTAVLEVDIELTGENVLYKPNQIIPANILNEVYQSSGTLTYRNHPSAVNSSGSTKDFQIHGLNTVTVHTPVLCDASITTQNTTTGITSNDPYVQVLAVEKDCVQLVLDPDSKLSDFTVDINNYGTHLMYAGFYTRDFAWSLRDSAVSYIGKYNNIYRNEVRFPFDVFYRHPSGKEEFIPKNTWMRFGHNTPTFFLPMWVNEGVYTVDFRTIAVNGVNNESQLTKTQTYANFDRTNYVATDTVKVQVSGRIYGLSLYDVSDYPTWETIFRIKTDSARLKLNEGYPSGVKDVK
ncbi:MAG TPA: DUF5704 domain-containing protein, partial [Mobilitalea sp.]|nr:DUF5704 domain-containing protein [Mobilitalea sp.]